ncbi:hypothetical protein N0V90_004055 [Kalmusia sp. IMI 367209]|nr:hypothetical protein N0V90_004055 [Kalmusia sp. IMI 367209]
MSANGGSEEMPANRKESSTSPVPSQDSNDSPPPKELPPWPEEKTPPPNELPAPSEQETPPSEEESSFSEEELPPPSGQSVTPQPSGSSQNTPDDVDPLGDDEDGAGLLLDTDEFGDGPGGLAGDEFLPVERGSSASILQTPYMDTPIWEKVSKKPGGKPNVGDVAKLLDCTEAAVKALKNIEEITRITQHIAAQRSQGGMWFGDKTNTPATPTLTKIIKDQVIPNPFKFVLNASPENFNKMDYTCYAIVRIREMAVVNPSAPTHSRGLSPQMYTDRAVLLYKYLEQTTIDRMLRDRNLQAVREGRVLPRKEKESRTVARKRLERSLQKRPYADDDLFAFPDKIKEDEYPVRAHQRIRKRYLNAAVDEQRQAQALKLAEASGANTQEQYREKISQARARMRKYVAMAHTEQEAWKADEAAAFNDLDSEIQTIDPEGMDDSSDDLTDLTMERMDLGDDDTESTDPASEDEDEMTEEELKAYKEQAKDDPNPKSLWFDRVDGKRVVIGGDHMQDATDWTVMDEMEKQPAAWVDRDENDEPRPDPSMNPGPDASRIDPLQVFQSAPRLQGDELAQAAKSRKLKHQSMLSLGGCAVKNAKGAFVYAPRALSDQLIAPGPATLSAQVAHNVNNEIDIASIRDADAGDVPVRPASSNQDDDLDESYRVYEPFDPAEMERFENGQAEMKKLLTEKKTKRQPQNYIGALRQLQAHSRSRPTPPGWNAGGKHPIWPQINGAARIGREVDRAAQNEAAGEPHKRGMLNLNKRKRMLQQLVDKEDWKALAKFPTCQRVSRWIGKVTRAGARISVDAGTPIEQCPTTLTGLVEMLVADESHTVKNQQNSLHAVVRFLQYKSKFTILMSATPTPWRHTDIIGQLALIHNQHNAELVLENNMSRDTCAKLYTDDCPEDLFAVARNRYGFSRASDGIEGKIQAGVALKMIYEQIALARDCHSTCQVFYHPRADGSRTHCLGEAMPSSREVRLVCRFTKQHQRLYDMYATGHMKNLNTVDNKGKTDQVLLNGRTVRILTLMSTTPLFHFAKPMHHVKLSEKDEDAMALAELEDEVMRDEDDASASEDSAQQPPSKKSRISNEGSQASGKKSKKASKKGSKKAGKQAMKKGKAAVNDQTPKANPHLQAYERDFDSRKDHLFLRRFFRDIDEGMHTEYVSIKKDEDRKDKPKQMFGPTRPKPAEADPNNPADAIREAAEYIALLTKFAPRIQSLFAVVGDIVVAQGKKQVIFCVNPLEQMLVAIALRVMGVKAHAILAKYGSDVREELTTSFNKPLRHWSATGSGAADNDGDGVGEVEVLILSYSMNSGLNLQAYCHNLLAFSPATSLSIWLQAIGRIVRFGQAHPCLIIQMFMDGTYNTRTVRTSVVNYLSTFAATLSDSALSEAFGVTLGKIGGQLLLVNDELMHKNDPELPDEYKDQEPLTEDQALVALFNKQDALNLGVRQDKKDGLKSTQRGSLFSTAAELGLDSSQPNTPSSLPVHERNG